MSVKMSVYYREPENPETFEKHYVQNHLPLIDRYERISHRSFHKVTRRIAGEFPYSYVFTGTWEDFDGFKSDLNSEAAAEATKDASSMGVAFDVVVFEQLA